MIKIETTKDLYFHNGKYVPERAELHNRIIEQIVSEHRPPRNQPDVVMLGGGAAAGKTSIRNMLIDMFRDEGEDVLVSDSDELKKMLPEYERLVNEDPDNMATILHDESSDLATMLYVRAVAQKLNVIMDGTMKNVMKYSRFIQIAKSHGYIVSAVVADIPLEVAIERAEIRFQIEKRKVPLEVIKESHRMVPETLRALEHQFDLIYLYDTSGKHPTQFYVKDMERVLVRNEERLTQFFEKSKRHLVLKDLIMQVDGMPSIYNRFGLSREVLNSEVDSYTVKPIGQRDHLLSVKLKNNSQQIDIRMDKAPFIHQDLKKRWIEQAASPSSQIKLDGPSRGYER